MVSLYRIKSIQRKMRIATCLLVGFIGLFQPVWAQNSSDKFRQEIKKVQLERTRIVDSLIEKAGYPRFRSTEKNTIELMGLKDNGLPDYWETQNLEGAKTLRTHKLWPNRFQTYNLAGLGMRLAEWDGGAIRLTHREIIGRAIQKDGATTLSDHASHVGGTMIASGITREARGQAWQATLWAHDWSNDENEMMDAADSGITVSNHSYGSICGWRWEGGWVWYGPANAYEDPTFGFYSSRSRGVDLITNSKPYYLPVIAAGNARDDGPSPGATHTIAGANPTTSNMVRTKNGPYNIVEGMGVSKNGFTVGAVSPDTNGIAGPQDIRMSGYSCWGPTDDGRIKPDVVAAGSGIYSILGTGDSNYGNMTGTSMAAPSVTGSLLLLQEQYGNYNSKKRMTSALLKAVTINTTDEAGANEGPDFQFGWGLMNTEAAASAIANNGGSAIIKEDTVFNGLTKRYLITSDGTKPIRATIAWNDPAGTPPNGGLNPRNRMLVNDLDIRIFNPQNLTYFFPWKLDVEFPANAAFRGDNIVDNVERIDAGVLPAGTYEIIVSFKDSLRNRFQPYGLAVTGLGALPEYCRGSSSIRARSGFLDDGSWNNNYLPNTNCEYRVESPDPTYGVLVKFRQFSLLSGDSLEILDIQNGVPVPVTKLSGNQLPPFMVSQGTGFLFKFTSDETQESTGWNLLFEVIKKPEISYTVSADDICAGNSITLNATARTQDTTRVQFLWDLPGATPSSATGRQISVQYPLNGRFSVNLKGVNIGGTTDLIADERIKVRPSNGLFTFNHIEDFSNTAFPRWNADTLGNYTTTTSFSSSISNWERTTQAFYSAPAALRIVNRGLLAGNTRSIISPSFDLTGLPAGNQFCFNYAWAARQTTNTDALHIEFSYDCGSTWNRVKSLNQSSTPSLSTTGSLITTNFIPNSTAQWSSICLPLIQNSSSFRFRYVMVNGGGNNLFIDDISFRLPNGLTKKLFEKQLMVYLNPTANQVAIDLGEPLKGFQKIRLCDLLGKTLIETQTENSIEFLEVKNLKPGTYLIVVEGYTPVKLLKN